MTRTYAAKRLLEHGGLTFGQYVTITGWTEKQVDGAISSLLKSGVAVRFIEPGCHRYIYRLAE